MYFFKKRILKNIFLTSFIFNFILILISTSVYSESPDIPGSQSNATEITLDYFLDKDSRFTGDGYLYGSGEDWVKFTLTETKWVIVDLYELSGGEVFVQLRGSAGNFLSVAEGQDNTSSGYIFDRTYYDDEVFIKAQLAAGTYYIRMYLDPGSNSGTKYSLSVVATKESPEFSDTFSSPTNIGDLTSTDYTGYVDGEFDNSNIDESENGDEDFLQFNVTKTGIITIDVKEIGGEQYINFSDGTATGENIESVTSGTIGSLNGYYVVNENTNYDDRAYIQATIKPGTYYLRIENRTSGRDDHRSFASINLSFVETGTEWFQDADGDTYGCNPAISASCQSMFQADQPSGYVDNKLDCDDDNANVHPGAAELCNSIDDDCNGDVDDGLTDVVYYLDADADGYGDATNYISRCSQPPGYVTNNTDCNDSNAAIHPGAFDSCSTDIDENCSGGNDDCSAEPEYCAKLSDVPLETQIESAPPLVMLLVDDSGSMAWDNLCPENNGNFAGKSYVSNVKAYWKSQWSGYNGVYYDPTQDYLPWPDSTDATYDDADTDTPRKHPNNTNTTNLSNSFTTIDGVSILYSHYYVWVSSEAKPYLVNISGSNGSYSVSYYKSGCAGDCSDDHVRIDELDAVTGASVPDEVKIKRTAAEERQNFANWYQYYRTRQLTALSALALVINNSEKMKIGLHTLNHGSSINMVRPRLVKDHKGDILDDLYDIDASGGTPLRLALKAVGQMYDNDSDSPFDGVDTGGFCQQAYTILMSDGYYNGSSPSVGNADGDNNTTFDGSVYADTYSNTLADVAMYYYERDLQTGLTNSVPISTVDKNQAQHMVTYTVSFGLTGNLDPSSYNCPSISCPSWPDGNTDNEKIDDLWHTAVNGRGEYLSASNAQQLVSTLQALIKDIEQRVGSGASVAVNTETLQEDTTLYQGSYDSNKWTGNLEAFPINSDNGSVADSTHEKYWSAAIVMDSKASTYHQSRNIISMNTETNAAIEFKYDQLSESQKTTFGSDAESIVNFIRGDRSNEIKNGGGLRTRGSLLGDIVHSAPVHFKNTNSDLIFVGANDGMLHVFNADSSSTDKGNEIFAYVPGFLYNYGRLKSLADPDYSHKYFIDNTPYIKKLNSSKTLLTCGLGRGGKGYFTLDISPVLDGSTTTDFTKDYVEWEYPNKTTGATAKENMGYSFSAPAILPVNDSTFGGNGYAIFFGNGYDSETGKALLYILSTDADESKTIMLDTETGGTSDTDCNGLSSPSFLDTNLDGKVDYVYAGDMQGNVWKFDLTSSDSSNWGFAYKDSSGDPKPVVQVIHSSGNKQPITSKIGIIKHCQRSKLGYILVFGTGSFNSVNDFDNTSVQSIYAVWDWQAQWQYLKDNKDDSITITDKYLGVLNSSGKFTNIENDTYFDTPSISPTLLQQTQVDTDDKWGLTSSNQITWFDPADFYDKKSAGDTYSGGQHLGWFFNLPNTGERVIANPTLRAGLAVIVTLDPSRSPCETGGNSLLRVFNSCSGTAATVTFDTDNDNDFDDELDNLKSATNPTGIDLTGSPNVIELSDIYYKPVVVSDPSKQIDLLYFGKGVPPIKIEMENDGLIYWKINE